MWVKKNKKTKKKRKFFLLKIEKVFLSFYFIVQKIMTNSTLETQNNAANITDSNQDQLDVPHVYYQLAMTDNGKRIFCQLADCNCCERHKVNKPTKMEDGWVETPFHGTQDTPCACNCRHRMRFMARAYNSPPGRFVQSN